VVEVEVDVVVVAEDVVVPVVVTLVVEGIV
jgi:hypothetical protein